MYYLLVHSYHVKSNVDGRETYSCSLCISGTTMWVFSTLLTFIFALHGETCAESWNLSLVTWNVNGAAKFRGYLPELQYMNTFDVIFLQETFTVDARPSIELDGYITFHTPARPTARRPQWGMTSFFRISSFVGGHLRSVQSPCDWLQVCNDLVIQVCSDIVPLTWIVVKNRKFFPVYLPLCH